MDAHAAATDASVEVSHRSPAMDEGPRGVSESPELVLVPPLGTDDQSSVASGNAEHQDTDNSPLVTGKEGRDRGPGAPKPAPGIEDGDVHGKQHVSFLKCTACAHSCINSQSIHLLC